MDRNLNAALNLVQLHYPGSELPRVPREVTPVESM
jgi:hypothetical protein